MLTENQVLKQNLFSTDVSYPQETKYAYLKLLSHAWNFGRFDLGVLGLEWAFYLIFTSLVLTRLIGIFTWSIGYISIFFYIALALGIIRSLIWYMKLNSNLKIITFLVEKSLIVQYIIVLSLSLG